MIVENVHICNNLNQLLPGRIYRTETESEAAVVFSHGLFSNKDGYKITRLARDIVSSGYTLLTFDFSFTGESGGSMSDLSLFQEVRDLASAIVFIKGRGVKHVHLMGSSMGALVTMVCASGLFPSPDSLMLIATPVDVRSTFLANGGIGSYPENGSTIIDDVPIKNKFFRELYGINMEEILKKIISPVLAIHGGRDAVVDRSNVGLLEIYLPRGLKKIIIEDGDHNLTRDSDIEMLRDAVISWLKTF
jgi:pimeloyl-ACP methyl ester carboxylesterase